MQVLRPTDAQSSANPIPRADFTHTIDGGAVAGSGVLHVLNPATETVFAHCPDLTPAAFETSVAAARRAFQTWRFVPLDERRQKLLALAAALRDHKEELATLLTQEQGKPLVNARREIDNSVHHIEQVVTIDIGVEVLQAASGDRAELHFRPLGVIGAITPWNVPVGIAIQKIAQALYTGNTMVLKPSPYTPLTTLKIGELSRTILPPGVLNVVAGGNEVGAWLTQHPHIEKISFTGSLPTGRKVAVAGVSANLKRLTLELGGNDAAIVLDDVHVAAVAPKLFAAAFANAGQVCMAIKRLYVQARVYEPVCAALTDLANKIRVGDGMHPDTQMGPVQNAAQYRRVLHLLADARARPEARIVAGGTCLSPPGYFIAPTIVTGLREGVPLVDEEPFGPVLPVLQFDTVEEVLQRANQTRFGLSGSVWSANVARAASIAARLEVGTAWVNRHIGADMLLPFGGAKDSGVGREHGKLGLQSYMEAQVIQIAG